MSQLVDVPAIYAAGLVDGEGCIRISKYASGVTYKLCVFVKMVDKGAIDYLVTYFGGSIYFQNSTNSKHNSTYLWQLYSQKAGTFLTRIYPYLQVKRRQAELGIICAGTAEYSNSGYIPEDVMDLRESCFQEMTKLNKRGTSPAETEREDLQLNGGCDSPTYTNDKGVEVDRNVQPSSNNEL